MKNKFAGIERPKTCVIYVRVSSEEQTHGYSLGSQEKDCRGYAVKNGWEVLRLFREEGESAKTADRTQLGLMQNFCLKNIGKVGHVVVWKVDRFARNQHDHFTLRKFFQDCGADLKSATENIENTPVGKDSEGMLAVMSEYENNVRIERTTMGIRARALDGYWIAGAPWGYKNTLDSLGKKVITPHPERSSIVQFIFQEYARGTIGYRDLARKVNKLGDVRSRHGLKISVQLVYKILKNPIYCGRIVVPRLAVDVQGKHERLVPQNLFDEVQEIIRGGKKYKRPKNRDNAEFPLRGIACLCGRNISGGFSTGKKKKKYAYYGCINPTCPTKKAIRKDDFEKEFSEFLGLITPDVAMLDGLGEALRVVHRRESKENLLQAKRIDSAVEKISKDMEELLQIKIRGLIDDETFIQQSEKMRAQKRDMEIEQANLKDTDNTLESAMEVSINLIKEFPTAWKMLEPGELRILRGLFFPQNLVYQYPGFKTHELAPIYRTKAPNEVGENRWVTSRGIEPRFHP